MTQVITEAKPTVLKNVNAAISGGTVEALVDAAKAEQLSKAVELAQFVVPVEQQQPVSGPTESVINVDGDTVAPVQPPPVSGPVESVIDVGGDTVAPKISPVATLPPVNTAPVVKIGRWNPASGVGAIPLSEQVNKEYALITSNAYYAVTRLKNYTNQLPVKPASYAFKPVGSEAFVREGTQYTAATVSDAKLRINVENSDSAVFATEFKVSSDVYNDVISATGTVSKNGILTDDRKDRFTVIRGAVAGDDTTLRNAAYGFYKSIDTNKDTFGGITWEVE